MASHSATRSSAPITVIVRLYEGHLDAIREELGHDNFMLKAVDVYVDGRTEPRWELLPEPGPFTVRADIRFGPVPTRTVVAR